ncbi:MAG: hypothetical protein F9K18_02730 [Thermoanaerobaculia bacterium]|nr:MAG: hypothetical protein F9K18_02730 [Thermoanaerobaculia bacterium]
MERTSEFFVGTVVAAEHLNIPKPGEFSDELYLVATIEVEELWYGDHSWRKEVYTSAFPTACGVIFKVGEKFIVESELIGETELKTSELPKAASWTDSCQTKPFSPEVYQEKTEWLKDFASPWKPHAKRISLEF